MKIVFTKDNFYTFFQIKKKKKKTNDFHIIFVFNFEKIRDFFLKKKKHVKVVICKVDFDINFAEILKKQVEIYK